MIREQTSSIGAAPTVWKFKGSEHPTGLNQKEWSIYCLCSLFVQPLGPSNDREIYIRVSHSSIVKFTRSREVCRLPLL